MIMRYVVVPIDDVRGLFTADELEHARKDNAGTRMIVHEGTLLSKRERLGLTTLPMDAATGLTEWTYPVYEHGSAELDALLQSDEWASMEERM
ncbi:MAG TPA: hypothetical protein H9824_05770 [Candidatus Bacteroides pullicola]|uniref:Uncharacterized protein n=1 Tax=Candidatus Bacteroides pullicola TaxID=2838475 RepID=A0A9D2CL54_9BACE|nr:hypothetical protein [Candidatus Bacteroides pullicola]